VDTAGALAKRLAEQKETARKNGGVRYIAGKRRLKAGRLVEQAIKRVDAMRLLRKGRP
jgi:hypothetical protein